MAEPGGHQPATWIPSWYQLQRSANGVPFIALPAREGWPSVFLTPFIGGEEDALVEALNVESINKALISIPRPYTREHAELWAKSQRSQPDDSTLRMQVIRVGDPEAGKLAGAVTLTPHESAGKYAKELRDEKDEAELGYYLHPQYQGKGVMRDAVLALITWAVTEKGLKSVLVLVADENVASRKVVESFHEFQPVGESIEVDYPEQKGGGRKRLSAWKWRFE